MPHFTIEYSANLDKRVDMGVVVELVRKSAVETGIFPIGGIRVRAIKCEHFAIGDGSDGKIAPSVSGETFETKSPVDGSVLASVARGNAEDIDRAAKAASVAFKSWRDMPAATRRKLLHRVADAIEDNADDIAVL